MKILLFIVAILPSLLCLSQSKENSRVSVDSSIEKWNRSVIALEAIQDPPEKVVKFYDELFDKKLITYDKLTKVRDSLSDIAERSLGTAIFVKYNGIHFLLSARHVFADNVNDSNGMCGSLVLVENAAGKPNDTTGQRFIESGTGNDLPAGTFTPPNGIILHNVEIEDARSEVRSLRLIFNYFGRQEFVFSNKTNDIGLIALDKVPHGRLFTQTLYNRGYVPIEIDDIDTTCNLMRLDSIFCIGYPEESIVERHVSSAARATYLANIKAINFVSNGFIFASPRNSNFFEAAMFTYHGFSGGPVIRNNKLIGMVSGFDPEIKVNQHQAVKAVVVYHSRFIKSSIIYKYLQRFSTLQNPYSQ
jgi:hypothetical protein